MKREANNFQRQLENAEKSSAVLEDKNEKLKDDIGEHEIQTFTFN